MSKYRVFLTNTVSTAITVDADNPQAAIDLAYDSHDMPGSITVGAFGAADVDEDGEWQPHVVTDETGKIVWHWSKGESDQE